MSINDLKIVIRSVLLENKSIEYEKLEEVLESLIPEAKKLYLQYNKDLLKKMVKKKTKKFRFLLRKKLVEHVLNNMDVEIFVLNPEEWIKSDLNKNAFACYVLDLEEIIMKVPVVISRKYFTKESGEEIKSNLIDFVENAVSDSIGSRDVEFMGKIYLNAKVIGDMLYPTNSNIESFKRQVIKKVFFEEITHFYDFAISNLNNSFEGMDDLYKIKKGKSGYYVKPKKKSRHYSDKLNLIDMLEKADILEDDFKGDLKSLIRRKINYLNPNWTEEWMKNEEVKDVISDLSERIRNYYSSPPELFVALSEIKHKYPAIKDFYNMQTWENAMETGNSKEFATYIIIKNDPRSQVKFKKFLEKLDTVKYPDKFSSEEESFDTAELDDFEREILQNL